MHSRRQGNQGQAFPHYLRYCYVVVGDGGGAPAVAVCNQVAKSQSLGPHSGIVAVGSAAVVDTAVGTVVGTAVPVHSLVALPVARDIPSVAVLPCLFVKSSRSSAWSGLT
eukprot:m.67102 g.67102  ORF g.67102 m.67102 type:complete len:110 (-) comp12156_c0_seq2:365-694(-)